MSAGRNNKKDCIDAILEKIDAGELTEEEADDAFYGVHYGRPRPARVPEESRIKADSIVGFDDSYVGYGFIPGFQMLVTVRHGDLEIIEETEKALKLSGRITLDGISYEMLPRWVPKKALSFKDQKGG